MRDILALCNPFHIQAQFLIRKALAKALKAQAGYLLWKTTDASQLISLERPIIITKNKTV